MEKYTMSLPPILTFAVVLSFGFLCGEITEKLKLPKVTGYILAGVLLNPGISHVIAPGFADHTAVLTNIALSFITFSVGGTLLYSRVKRLGTPIVYITLLEAELAFLFVAVGTLPVMALFVHIAGATWVSTFIPLGVLLACLASPTDPSATLAVVHEYKAHDPVTSTIMGVAAFDDVTGIINYSLAVVVAQALCDGQGIRFSGIFVEPIFNIGGAVLLGIAFGFAFNIATVLLKRETEGALIVMVFGMLAGCFGLATVLGADELLATMSMGIVVVNYNRKREKIFKLLER
jgi:NhaP-type Na+/H+ or K+/H+ antiporter